MRSGTMDTSDKWKRTNGFFGKTALRSLIQVILYTATQVVRKRLSTANSFLTLRSYRTKVMILGWRVRYLISRNVWRATIFRTLLPSVTTVDIASLLEKSFRHGI